MSDAGKETVTLKDTAGKDHEMAVISGSVGPKVIDIRKLYGDTGCFTYDPGFTSTASCESKITYIDGEEGILLYRGYPIEQLAERQRFPRSRVPLELRGAADRSGKDGFRSRYQAPYAGARAVDRLLPRLPPRCASHGDHVRRRRRPVGLLPRLDRHFGSRAAARRLPPHDREDADHRGDDLQVFRRPALCLSAEQPRVFRELPAHDVQRAGRALCRGIRSWRVPWTAS